MKFIQLLGQSRIFCEAKSHPKNKNSKLGICPTYYFINKECSIEAKNKHYPEEFKKQIVELYENGKTVIEPW